MSRSETVRETQRSRAEAGLHPANLPLGYVPGRHCAVPDPLTAPLVKEAVERAASRTASVRSLYLKMTQKGFLTNS